MLWRSHVEPVEISPGQWSGEVGPEPRWVCLVGFGALSFRDRGVWKRLLQSEAPGFPFLEWVVAPRAEWEMIRAAVPPSERNTLQFLENASLFTSVLSDFAEHTAAALLIEGDQVLLGFHGVPNEDAWERFLAAIQDPRTVS